MPKQTTSTTATTITDTRTADVSRKGGNSPAIQAYRAQQAEWARVWHSLPASVKNGFQKLAALTTPLRANGKPRVSAFFFFSHLNTAIVNAGGEPIVSPPAAPQPPQTLPKQVTLTCTGTSSAVSIKIQCAAYASKVVIYGAAPTMADTPLRPSDFTRIGFVPSLPAANVGAMYAAAFGLPQDGEKVALQLMGVSASGYTTIKQGVDCLAAVTPAEAAGTDDAADTASLSIAQ